LGSGKKSADEIAAGQGHGGENSRVPGVKAKGLSGAQVKSM
jgi:hypothetical protein